MLLKNTKMIEENYYIIKSSSFQLVEDILPLTLFALALIIPVLIFISVYKRIRKSNKGFLGLAFRISDELLTEDKKNAKIVIEQMESGKKMEEQASNEPDYISRKSMV